MQKNRFSLWRFYCLMGLLALLFGQSYPAAAENDLAEGIFPEAATQACGSGQPLLYSPTDLAHLTSLNTAFQFGPLSDVSSYKLEVATENTFSLVEPEKSERAYTFTISNPAVASYNFSSSRAQNFLPETTYYWRVTPKCGATFGTPSSIFSFITPASSTLLPAPKPVYPSKGALTLATTVTFGWNSVSEATSYQLRVYAYPSNASSDSSFLSKADGVLMGIHTNMTQIPTLPTQTTIYWRVAAVNSYAVGVLSEVFSFTTPVIENQQVITNTGGTLTTTAGVEINAGPGVLASPTEIQFTALDHPSVGNHSFRLANRSFTLTATRVLDNQPVTQFSPYLTLTIHLTEEDLEFARIMADDDLFLYFYDGTTWKKTLPYIIDYPHALVIYRVTHFTEFALGSPETVFIPAVCR